MVINWGKKILLLYLGFVTLIVMLVWKSTQVKLNLVSEDYYAQEISFQRKLDARQASAGLSQKPVVSATPDAILIFFPQEFAGKDIKADLHLYNPANAALDKSFPGQQAAEGKIAVQRAGLPAANYIAKLAWTCDGKSYYQETPLNLIWK
jgi:hypothetical protein